MAKFRGSKTLPGWFDINNYLAAVHFGAKEAYRQLYQRQYLMGLLKVRNENTPVLSDFFAEAFAQNIKSMRGPIEDTNISAIFGADGYEAYLADKKRGVDLLTFRHLLDHARNIPGCHQQPEKWFVGMTESISETSNASTTVDSPLFINGGQSMTHEKYAMARFNRNLPHKQLIDDFKTLLSEFPEEQLHYKPNFKDWARYGLFPYLDLKIWEMETGDHFPHKVMASAIRTGYVSNTKQLTDTLIPLADRLMNDGLDRLLEMAATESIQTPPIPRKK